MQAEVLTCSHFVPLTTLPFDGLGISARSDADTSRGVSIRDEFPRVADPVLTNLCHGRGMPPGKQAQAMGCEEIEAAA